LSGLDRIREAVKRDKSIRLNNLMHHMTIDLLREAYQEQKSEAAPGIDGVTWEKYGVELEANLSDLRKRVFSGRYRATPSKRVWIPKPDGSERPLGIPVLEDKIIQQAVVWITNQVYEEDFLGFSYGFRPGRSQHNALDALSVGITQRKVNWVLDADIQSFFDRVDHEWMMEFIKHRISDPKMLRLIQKWLRAGVSEQGQWSKTTVGTPQGAVISPLLANIYLHFVLDLWVRKWRETQAQGDVIFVRYADDFVMGFQHKQEAIRFLEELKKRLAKYKLTLHPDKTRLIEFGRYAEENRKKCGEGKPETFDFLGFTHVCARSRKGKFIVHVRTMRKRLQRSMTGVAQWCRKHRHDRVCQVFCVTGLSSKLAPFLQT